MTKYINSLLLTLFLSIGFANITSAAKLKTNGGKELELKLDDPIAAILDSLQTLKLFECSTYSTDTCALNTYNYSPDFIPYFDDLTLESRLSKLDANSPFDLVYNESVKHYIELYSHKKRNVVSKVLGLSHLYFNLFEEQLDRYNLPLELKYLAIVESALNPSAISRTGAAGLWQFMLPTGKMFGLEVTSYVDERRDPYKSTLAACKYLKYLYNLFNDWQMVLAAYNSGPGTISKAIRRSGGKTTYWEIRPFLPTETQNYVPAFIAVNYVMNYSREHNLYPVTVRSNYFFADTVRLQKEASFMQIATVIDMPIDEIKFLNPSYKLNIIPYQEEGSMLCLPANKVGSFINNEANIYKVKVAAIQSNFVAKQLNTPEKFTHKVKSKETLSSIAAEYGTTVSELKKWNKIKGNTVAKGRQLAIYKLKPVKVNADSKHLIVASKVIDKKKENFTAEEMKQIDLEFADSNTAKDTTIVASDSIEKPDLKSFVTHTVQPGDTLWNIASRYKGATVEALKKINKINSSKGLKVGDKIKVPIG